MEREAVVRIFCAGRAGIHTGFLKSLSAGGMFLHIVDPEPSGTRLHFELRLDPRHRATVTGSGEVVYSRDVYGGPGRPPGMGVRFLALTPEGAEEVERVVGAPADASIATDGGGPVDAPTTETPRGIVPGDEPPIPAAEAPVSPAPGLESGAVSEAGAREAPEEAPIVAREELYDLSEYGLPGSRPWWRRAFPTAGLVLALVAASLVVASVSGWLPRPPSEPSPPAVAEATAPTTAASSTLDPHLDGGIAEEPNEPSAPIAEAMPPSPLERVEAIDWEASPRGLVVVVRGDGAFEPGRASYSHIGGEAPRGVVRIRDVERSLDRLRQELDSPLVRTVRTGFHGERGGRGDLHVVLDFRDPEARITGILPSGRELLIYVSGP